MSISETCLFFLLFFSSLSIFAQEDSTKAITIEAGYQGDVMGNVREGLKTGASYVGWASANIQADFEKLGLWRGGSAFVEVAWSHGGMPSKHYVGDIQGVNSNETGILASYRKSLT